MQQNQVAVFYGGIAKDCLCIAGQGFHDQLSDCKNGSKTSFVAVLRDELMINVLLDNLQRLERVKKEQICLHPCTATQSARISVIPVHGFQTLKSDISKRSISLLNLNATQNCIVAAMLISLTVGKVDAGVAVLLTEDKRLVGPDHCSSSSPSTNTAPTD